MEAKEKVKRLKIRRILTTVILAAAVVVVLVLVIWFRVLTLTTIRVTGASLYPEDTVIEEIKSDGKSWNTAYVYRKYRDGQMKELPYLDSVKVTISDPHTIEVALTEKEALGYFYDETAQQYAAFDADGLVLKISDEEIDTEVRIRGLEVESYALYETMELSDSTDLDSIESVLALLESYEFLPDSVLIRIAGTIVLDYGDIQVNLGTTNYLNEKIARMVKIWDKIEDRKGTLHLETWTESTTDIHFRKKELLDLDDPDATYDTSDADSSEDADAESTESADDADESDADTADSDDESDADESYEDESYEEESYEDESYEDESYEGDSYEEDSYENDSYN